MISFLTHEIVELKEKAKKEERFMYVNKQLGSTSNLFAS